MDRSEGQMKKIRLWLRTLGPAGVIGAGVLFSCVPFYLSSVRPAESWSMTTDA